MRVLRVYHAGRDRAHRLRENALVQAGADLVLVVPAAWPERGAEQRLSPEPFRIVELAVSRPSDVNRHRYADPAALANLVLQINPDLIDLHEEPFSLAARQWLKAAGSIPCVAYAAQNVDKRFPPPFAQYERSALSRLNGLYPCSRQAASVARGKGFRGLIDVLPLGFDASGYRAGDQRTTDEHLVLGLVGRLVPEKGVTDALHVLADLRRHRSATLQVVGEGPAESAGRKLAACLGVADAVDWRPWRDGEEMASAYRSMHVLLLPSRATETWTEQFGRVIVEAQASGAVVVGYRSGAISEVCGRAGLAVQEGDVSALSHAVQEVLSQEVTYQGRRAQGLDQVRGMTWREIGRRQLVFYDKVLAGPEPVPSGRRDAQREFGPPATLRGGARRPFALPYLRHDTHLTRGLGAIVDLGTSLANVSGRSVR